jgi:hypothetical protein
MCIQSADVLSEVEILSDYPRIYYRVKSIFAFIHDVVALRLRCARPAVKNLPA